MPLRPETPADAPAIAALGRLPALGFRGAVLVGEPACYRRFGFVPHPGLAVPGIPPDCVLGPGFAPPPRGAIACHPAFGLDPPAA